MEAKTKIVILGAGYAGVEAAKVLNKKFKNDSSVKITLIDQNPYHTLLTELHEIAGHRTNKESVMIDLYQVFKATKVELITEKVIKVDQEKQLVTSERTSYEYDYLVLGVGSEPAFFGVPGVKENAFTIWSLKDALKIRHHIEDVFRRARAEKDPKKREKLLTIIVAGSGFTGVEVVGELMEWKKLLCAQHDIPESEVTLYNVEAMPNILPNLKASLQTKAKNYMIKKGVKVLNGAAIVKATEEGIVLKDGTEISTDTLIWTCGVQGNSFCVETGFTEGKRCRVLVNDYLQTVDKENIYAVGDNAYYEINGRPIPQIVETAIQTGECAAKNIIADIKNKEKEKFQLNTHGFMVSVGSHYCVAEVMGVQMSGFIAMMMKHLVNMHYLWGVGGLRLIWNYLRHEFFHMEDRRSFVGGHLSQRTQSLWLIPLRIYVGILWLIEGINKVNDGWLEPGNIKIVQVAGNSGASQAAEGAAGAAQTWVTPILSAPPAVYQWFMDTVVTPNAMLFQTSVVVMEILIGLALIAGLFTFLASIASMGLVANFILSAMAGYDILWYVFAAIVLMGGAGRTFGLDHYVIPWIKKWWTGTKFAREHQLYFD
ncbi:MAG: FAD-dependent oxidoreductase [Lutispora sp.]|nr:FAD-dependent oxidoreductase [Lutispora sp.]MDD4833596.1 FAD-dependent oxidoreductase [Lutispora sp.]